jgi:hypothetical protein
MLFLSPQQGEEELCNGLTTAGMTSSGADSGSGVGSDSGSGSGSGATLPMTVNRLVLRSLLSAVAFLSTIALATVEAKVDGEGGLLITVFTPTVQASLA